MADDGPRTAELEERFADYVGARHAVALASGTAAMHLALVGIGIGPGDEVIVADHLAGDGQRRRPHRRDPGVRRRTRHRSERRSRRGARGGHSADEGDHAGRSRRCAADLDRILELGVPVVEDAAHAIESVYRGRKVGSISHATAFSLYATKNVAAGEGGILTTDDDELAEAVLRLRLMRRSHGSLYDIEVAGFKANLSDVLASLALVQLGKIEEHAEIAAGTSRPTTPGSRISTGSSRSPEASGRPRLHLYIVGSTPSGRGRRDDYQRALADENIGTSIHFLPVHRLTYYRRRFPTSRSSRSPSARPARSCRSLSRRLTRTRTSRARSRRFAAFTRRSAGPSSRACVAVTRSRSSSASAQR